MPELLRLLQQHRLQLRAAKKDWDKAEDAYKKAIEMQVRRRRRPTTVWRTSTTRSASSTSRREASAKATELAGDCRPLAVPAATPTRMYNQGVILWNAGKIAEAKKPFEAAVAGQSESRRSALSARHGARERRQPGGRRDRVRDLPEARARRAERRDGQGARRRSSRSSVRFRRAPGPAGRRSRSHRARRRPGRTRPRLRPPHRRLQDLLRRRTSAPPPTPARSTSARTRSRKRLPKMHATADLPLRWHLIGHLQSNKARKAAALSTSFTRSTPRRCCARSTRRPRPRARRSTC